MPEDDKPMERAMEEKHVDFPFDDVVKKALMIIGDGVQVHQKFTCAGCGQRLTMEEPNHFYTEGTCDQCPTITNIEKQGCNFLIHAKALR